MDVLKKWDFYKKIPEVMTLQVRFAPSHTYFTPIGSHRKHASWRESLNRWVFYHVNSFHFGI